MMGWKKESEVVTEMHCLSLLWEKLLWGTELTDSPAATPPAPTMYSV